MQKLIWQNSNGESVDLTQAPYGITNWEGFANTSLNIQSQQVPFQDGGVFLDALMEQRELSVTLAIQDNNDLEARYRMRRELIHILNPKLGEGYLIYKNDFTEKRIKCVAQIPLFETHNSNDIGTPKASLAWTACEPYWEDVEETVIEKNGSVIEIETNYNGDVKTGFELEISRNTNGNVTIFSNEKKDNLYLKDVFNVKINTNLGQKSVSSIGFFGDNLIRMSSDNYQGTISFSNVIFCKWKNKYVGYGEYGIFTSSDCINWHRVLEGNFNLFSEPQGYVGAYIIDDINEIIIIGHKKSTDLENWENTSGSYTSLTLNTDTNEVYYSQAKMVIYHPMLKQFIEYTFVTSNPIIRIGIGENWKEISLSGITDSNNFNAMIPTFDGFLIAGYWPTALKFDFNGNYVQSVPVTYFIDFFYEDKKNNSYNAIGGAYMSSASIFWSTKDGINYNKEYTYNDHTIRAVIADKNIAFAYNYVIFNVTINENQINKIKAGNLDFSIDKGKIIYISSQDNTDMHVKLKYRQKYIGV